MTIRMKLNWNTASRERRDTVMDIYAPNRTKVIFTGASEAQENWGGHASHDVLEEGHVYTVDRTEVHSWHTKVFLQEYPDKSFNSTCFEETHMSKSGAA